MRWPSPLSVRTRLTLWYTGALLAILLVISALSYSLVRWSLVQDLDASLVTVAQVIADTAVPPPGSTLASSAERVLREALGPEFYDKFFQLLEPNGTLGLRSTHLSDETLPLSPNARANAARGVRTFETVQLASHERVRLLTMPIVRNGRVAQLVQVGISLAGTQQALTRYVEALLVLVPLGIGLAAVGGATIARAALKPVDEISRTARRITAEDLRRRLSLRGTGDELDHLAETLNVMLARLEEAFAQMRRFAADAAHELRTPLTALKGGIEVALRADRSPADYRRALVSSLEDVERLIRLAEDLLFLSRSTAGLDASRTPVDLEPLLLDVLEVGVRLARGTGVSVNVREVAPVTVCGDPVALRRALLNLVENAVKYTPAGGKVELSLACAGRAVEVTVEDTGIGIHPSDVERIFEPFVRLEAARGRETSGTGLGLTIARSIAVGHGGSLTVDSTPGAGSRFTIRLPLP